MTQPAWRTFARGGGALLVLAVVAVALHRVCRDIDLRDVEAAILAQPHPRLVACAALTALSFLCLGSYDVVGVQVSAPGRVRTPLAFLSGATSAAIANTAGLPAVTGAAVRAHLYLPAGLSAAQVAGIASMSWLSLAAGNAAMMSGVEAWQAATATQGVGHAVAGLGLAAAMLLGLAWLACGRRVVRLGRWRLNLPSARLAAAMTGLGAIESAAAIGALYVLVPADLRPSFDVFAIGCIAAVVLSVLSQVPGGLGVFEVAVSTMLSGRGRADLLGSLLLFRVVYNLLPFALSVVALGCRAGWKASQASSGSHRRTDV